MCRTVGLNRTSGHGTLVGMDEYLSASAKRALQAAYTWASRAGSPTVSPPHVLLGVAEQEESRGASILRAAGLTLDTLKTAFSFPGDDTAAPAPSDLAASDAVRQILGRMQSHTRARGEDNPAGTELLLLELLNDAELSGLFERQGTDVAALRRQLAQGAAADSAPLAVEYNLEIAGPTETIDTLRIVDACTNRACEGLRVLEDFARFACDDAWLMRQLKTARHELREAVHQLPTGAAIATRDTEYDVGTAYDSSVDWTRQNPLDVVTANFTRAQEALRSLEEFGKLELPRLARAAEAIRYRLYTLERAVAVGLDSRARFDGVVLYVIVGSGDCPGGLEWTVREALAGGAQVIQLREKNQPDRSVVTLARRLRILTREVGAMFIVNDRPDIARLAEADGVHVGQDELAAKDARRIIGPRGLVGVSTHSIEQARQAVLDGASYIGVGPTFPSSTKDFADYTGADLIAAVSAEIRLPAFAIGGIALDRIDQIVAAGARRAAVSAAVCKSADPRGAATELRRRLGATANAVAAANNA